MTENDPPPSTVAARNEFLTARQLAAILQVSESTVHRLAQKGRIPSISITPRIRRFHLNAVRDALNGNTGRARRKAAPPAAESAAENQQLPFTNFFE